MKLHFKCNDPVTVNAILRNSDKIEKRDDIKNTKVISFMVVNINGMEKNESLIYILTWATALLTPIPDSQDGQQYFVNKKCKFQNCYLTNNQFYFNDIKDFDVILFHAVVIHEPEVLLPNSRLETQKYIFMSNEPTILYPILPRHNGYFNYTFTYKLNSDTTWRFFVVRNKFGEVVAPKVDVVWMDINDMEETSDDVKFKLRNKNKAAAWFVSHCETPSQREIFARKLIEELDKYKLQVDIFGNCGGFNCSNEECLGLVERDYYFYLVFENSMCEDYVTEKVLIATKNFAVPIVYGGANYTRFLSTGSYLNANILGFHELAKLMNEIIKDKEMFYGFFKWQRYYSFHAHSEHSDTDEICALCAYLNNEKHSYTKSVYTHINKFWVT